MEKCVVKLVVFNGENFGYWKNQTRNYLLSQGRAIWKIVQEAYVIPAALNNATQGELQMYETTTRLLISLLLIYVGMCMIEFLI
jgi:hypothetical protein